MAKLLPKHHAALAKLNVRTDGWAEEGRREYIVPDVIVVDRSARYEDGDLAEVPIWGVEILSPGQTIGELFIRAERLLTLGCPLVWVIWPEKRKAWEYAAGDLREAIDTLAGPNDIAVSLAEMWAELD